MHTLLQVVRSERLCISHTICYRDGSNNGLQWLLSLAKDHKNGHLVNVKPTQDNKPGDMYSHVATISTRQVNA